MAIVIASGGYENGGGGGGWEVLKVRHSRGKHYQSDPRPAGPPIHHRAKIDAFL